MTLVKHLLTLFASKARVGKVEYFCPTPHWTFGNYLLGIHDVTEKQRGTEEYSDFFEALYLIKQVRLVQQ